MSKRFYDTTAKRTEPDMRFEFNATMDGLWPEIPKAQTFIIRKMRRTPTDTNTSDPAKKFTARHQIQDFFVPGEGFLVICPCLDKLTQEPDLDYFCPICQGEAYIWDEIFVEGYKVILSSDVGKSVKETLITPGLTNTTLVVFYTRSSVLITKADKIVEVWLDQEGKVVRPYRRKAIYRIGTPIDLRSDNGKLEYWKLDTYEEQRKYLNGPKVG